MDDVVDDGLPALPLLAQVHAPHLQFYPGLHMWRSILLCVSAKQCFTSSVVSEAGNTRSVSAAGICVV